jgi:hypothetical protein
MSLPRLINWYTPVSRAMKKPCIRSADWSEAKARPSERVSVVRPLGQLGEAKVREVVVPEKSGVRGLKNEDVKPPPVGSLASKGWVYLRYWRPLEAIVVSMA